MAKQLLSGSGPPPAAEVAPAAEWAAVAARLPELAAATPPGLQRFDASGAGAHSDWAAVAAICAALYRDGCVILERAVGEATCDTVIAEIAPYLDAAGYGDGFLGRATRRAGACVSRSPASRELIQHPLLLQLCRGVLGVQLLHLAREDLADWLAPGNQQFPFQLSLSQTICIGPDERTEPRPQPLHRDGWGFVMDMQQRVEPEISTMWALDAFNAENGATRVVLGSHRWPKARKPRDDEATQAVMPRGSCVLYLGDCFHSGGANHSTALRHGFNCDYNLAHLRQEENQFLACPPHVARTLSPELQELVGWTMPGTSFGYYAEYQHPREALQSDAGRIDWAAATPKL
jgi:hypothetical protein